MMNIDTRVVMPEISAIIEWINDDNDEYIYMNCFPLSFHQYDLEGMVISAAKMEIEQEQQEQQEQNDLDAYYNGGWVGYHDKTFNKWCAGEGLEICYGSFSTDIQIKDIQAKKLESRLIEFFKKHNINYVHSGIIYDPILLQIKPQPICKKLFHGDWIINLPIN